MNCARLRQMLDAWLDHELDTSTSSEIDRHLASCPECMAVKVERDRLRMRLAAGTPRYAMPPALRQAILKTARTARPLPARARQVSWWHAAGLAAGAALMSAAATFWFMHAVAPADNGTAALREQLVARHVASLARASPVDVAASDRHVVKPWFQGKVDFSPAVRDLSAQGFALRGARLDRLAGEQAVAVVYQVRQHPINLFVWRDAGDRAVPLAFSSARGFSLATWRDGGLAYAAVSDVEPGDLERFARDIQAPRSGP